MANRSKPRDYKPSLIHRIHGSPDEPGLAPEPLLSLEAIRKTVLEDLEQLLNTIPEMDDQTLGDHRELNNSILTYGLHDFIGIAPESQDVSKTVRQRIEKAIRLFEPRLKQIELTPVGAENPNVFRFDVSATLLVEPAPERIDFRTTFDLINNRLDVTEA